MDQTHNTESEKNDTTITLKVKKNSTWFMVLGVVTILLGVEIRKLTLARPLRIEFPGGLYHVTFR